MIFLTIMLSKLLSFCCCCCCCWCCCYWYDEKVFAVAEALCLSVRRRLVDTSTTSPRTSPLSASSTGVLTSTLRRSKTFRVLHLKNLPLRMVWLRSVLCGSILRLTLCHTKRRDIWRSGMQIVYWLNL